MKKILEKILSPGVRSTLSHFMRRFRLLIGSDYRRGYSYARKWKSSSLPTQLDKPHSIKQEFNPLWEYFTDQTEGHGIWKWEHYFDIYHRYFSKFVGSSVNVLEVGIYSGGSLGMWVSYFGDKCHIYGVDIEEACKSYERENVSVFIGDQEDPDFWSNVKDQVEGIDIFIDDGGHKPNQQMVTLEQMLPHLRPGGIYVCEDIDGPHHGFSAFVNGLVSELNSCEFNIDGPEKKTTPFQENCYSIHFYPYLVVIEKHENRPARLIPSRRGTLWQPFFDE